MKMTCLSSDHLQSEALAASHRSWSVPLGPRACPDRRLCSTFGFKGLEFQGY